VSYGLNRGARVITLGQHQGAEAFGLHVGPGAPQDASLKKLNYKYLKQNRL
jgi:hypothetical protein